MFKARSQNQDHSPESVDTPKQFDPSDHQTRWETASLARFGIERSESTDQPDLPEPVVEVSPILEQSAQSTNVADGNLSALEVGTVLALVTVGGAFTVTHLAKQFSRWIFWKTLRERLAHTKKANVPCTNCRFYNQNPYIKCTVHPYRALTKEALDCSDYWSKESDRFNR